MNRFLGTLDEIPSPSGQQLNPRDFVMLVRDGMMGEGRTPPSKIGQWHDRSSGARQDYIRKHVANTVGRRVRSMVGIFHLMICEDVVRDVPGALRSPVNVRCSAGNGLVRTGHQ